MKMKTHKGAARRIKITKNKKFLKARVRTSHLKVKSDTSRKYRQKRLTAVSKRGYIKKIKNLLGL